jgi:hypothetical protein
MKEQVRLGRLGFLEMNVIRMGRGGTAYVRVSGILVESRSHAERAVPQRIRGVNDWPARRSPIRI